MPAATLPIPRKPSVHRSSPRKPSHVARVAIAAIAALGLALILWFLLDPLFFSDLITRNHLRSQHVESRYVTVDGYRLHYFEALPQPGTPGTPLVLIHGLGSRGEDWSGMIPTLAAQGFHVYVPDMLGYGRSAKPDVDYSISLEERTITGFMNALHLTHADVGGWSMGGWVALEVTVDHPNLVDRLIVYDSAGIYWPATFDAALFTPTDSVGLKRLISRLTMQPMPLPPFVERAALRKLQRNAWIIQRSVSSMTSGHDLLDFRLATIHKPTLIVWGKQDRLIPLAVGETLQRDIAGASLLVVDGCGHLAPQDCAAPIVKATAAWLTAPTPPAQFTREIQGTASKVAVGVRSWHATPAAGDLALSAHP
jgi:pimeloyl-ACP methyl ester carboxylesterase